VINASPEAPVETRPLGLTRAMQESLLRYRTPVGVPAGAVGGTRTLAVSCADPPGASVMDVGLTSNSTSKLLLGATFTCAVARTPGMATDRPVIAVVPSARPVTIPVVSTVAIVVSADDQLVRVSVPTGHAGYVMVIRCEPPTGSVNVAGVTVGPTAPHGAENTLRSHCTELPPVPETLAMIVAWPTARAVITPVSESIAATAASLDDQRTTPASRPKQETEIAGAACVPALIAVGNGALGASWQLGATTSADTPQEATTADARRIGSSRDVFTLEPSRRERSLHSGQRSTFVRIGLELPLR
jgi:hypothetical protein